MSNINFERPFTAKQVADALGVSVHTIRARIFRREIPVLRFGRSVRVPADVVRKIIAESFHPAVDYKMAAAGERD